MLKLTYTEDGLHLERIAAPLETLIVQRVVLAMRAGQTLHIEPGRASFLLPLTAPGLDYLERVLRLEQSQVIIVTPVDSAFVEVSLQGSWIAETAAAQEGMFVATVTDFAELLVYKLWRLTQLQLSAL